MSSLERPELAVMVRQAYDPDAVIRPDSPGAKLKSGYSETPPLNLRHAKDDIDLWYNVPGHFAAGLFLITLPF